MLKVFVVVENHEHLYRCDVDLREIPLYPFKMKLLLYALRLLSNKRGLQRTMNEIARSSIRRKS